MLNHEWMRQRERRIRQGQREIAGAAEQEGVEAPAEEGVAQPLAPSELIPAVPQEPLDEAAAATASQPEVTTAPAEKQTELAPETAPEPAPPAVAAPAAETAPRRQPDPRQVVERLDVPVASLRERLSAVLAHQTQLPLDIEARQAVSDGVEGSPRETRDALVQRLLDPTLTLEEVSVLLGVCRTTVRRYTDRGVLRCFRTPGNQRRFHLTDVLDFMERQARGQV